MYYSQFTKIHTHRITEDITYCTDCRIHTQMSPVIRSALRLSRRLDLRNAIYIIYELNCPIVVVFAFAIDQGMESRSKFRFLYRRDTGASNSLLTLFSLPLFIVLPLTLPAGRIIEGYPLPRTISLTVEISSLSFERLHEPGPFLTQSLITRQDDCGNRIS